MLLPSLISSSRLQIYSTVCDFKGADSPSSILPIKATKDFRPMHGNKSLFTDPHTLACISAWPPTAKLFGALRSDLNLEIRHGLTPGTFTVWLRGSCSLWTYKDRHTPLQDWTPAQNCHTSLCSTQQTQPSSPSTAQYLPGAANIDRTHPKYPRGNTKQAK